MRRNSISYFDDMKQKALIITIIVLCASVVYAEQSEFIYSYSEKEYFPFHLGNGIEPPKTNPGIDIELLRLMEQRIPIQVIFKPLPWKRAQYEMEDGRVSAIIGSYKLSREQFGMYPRKTDGSIDSSKRIYSGDYALYILKDSSLRYDHQTREFINVRHGRRVVAELGYSIVDDLRKSGNKIEENDSGTYSMLLQLSLGRVDGVLAQTGPAQFYLRKHAKKFSNIVQTEPLIESKPAYIIISHGFYEKFPKISKQIWKISAELRQTKLPELYDKYYSLRIVNEINDPNSIWEN